MILEHVNSGHIEALGWENETMIIRFKNGKEYAYHNVPYDQYQYIKDSGSVGAALQSSGLKGTLI